MLATATRPRKTKPEIAAAKANVLSVIQAALDSGLGQLPTLGILQAQSGLSQKTISVLLQRELAHGTLVLLQQRRAAYGSRCAIAVVNIIKTEIAGHRAAPEGNKPRLSTDHDLKTRFKMSGSVFKRYLTRDLPPEDLSYRAEILVAQKDAVFNSFAVYVKAEIAKKQSGEVAAIPTVRQLAKRFKITRSTVWRWCNLALTPKERAHIRDNPAAAILKQAAVEKTIEKILAAIRREIAAKETRSSTISLQKEFRCANPTVIKAIAKLSAEESSEWKALPLPPRIYWSRLMKQSAT